MVVFEHPDNEHITILAAVADIPAPLGEAEFVPFKKNHVIPQAVKPPYLNFSMASIEATSPGYHRG
jgi:homogentisate 1,2-dioxygenase